jgi:hypothetical protein
MIAAMLAQAPPPAPTPSQVDAATIFYFTLIFIFLSAIVTAVVTKWWRDKCLKFFNRYHVTVEKFRGHTTWGQLKVFPTGLEVMFDHPYCDRHGRLKRSSLLYQTDVENTILAILRYHDELSEKDQKRRLRQVRRSFNPGPIRRMWRSVRNFVNTLRDAFNAAIGAVVGQYSRVNPANAVLSTQAASVTQIGQTLLGRLANAYEPLLEQYLGQPVILDVVDPINPNNATVEFTGFLADYTQQWIAIFNVEHTTERELRIELPNQTSGDVLPPLPGPPPPGAPAPVLPPPLKLEEGLAVRIDGLRMKIQNTLPHPVVVRRIERSGFQPVDIGMVIATNGTLDLPARDAAGGTLVVEVIRCLDVVAARKFAVIRHAGEFSERKGLTDDLNFDQIPFIPTIMDAFTRRTQQKDEDLTGDVT